MRYEYDDGGRSAAGFRGKTGDCVVRALAIAMNRDYLEVYKELTIHAGNERRSKSKRSHPRTGVVTSRQWFKDYMAARGFEWTATMRIGSGCTTHMRESELPMTGRHVLSVSKHVSALIDGVVRDDGDPTRGGDRCVYGYWTLKENT